MNDLKDKPNICIIVGPTAVGKTDISLGVAGRLGGEIISADSAQVYKYMDVGTAKLSRSEMQGIPHYMIDEVFPDEPFSVAEFRDRAEKYIRQIAGRNKLPVIAGGTGLYINSLLNNLEFTESVADEAFREEMAQTAQRLGNRYVHELLRDIDPAAYKKLHPNDLRRVIRALEVYRCTGKTITYFQEESKKLPSRYNYAYIGLTMDRKKLYNRIEERVELMIEKGLVEEVKGLLDRGYGKQLVSMQALGYKEIISYLEGRCSLEEAVEILKRDTRHYAKRQLTWFRNDPRVVWFDADEYPSREIMLENIIKCIAGKIVLL